jgi:hypothetical protein
MEKLGKMEIKMKRNKSVQIELLQWILSLCAFILVLSIATTLRIFWPEDDVSRDKTTQVEGDREANGRDCAFVGVDSLAGAALADSVRATIACLKFPYPEVVFMQARIESGNFTSKVFRDNNNMFGMRLPRIRPTLAVGERYGYAVYASWRDSVIDRLLLELWSYKGLSIEAYLKKLDTDYAMTENYSDLLIN